MKDQKSLDLHQIQPLSHELRWHWLDALRGLALLGILLVNVQQMFFIQEFADGPYGINSEESGVWSHWALINSLFDLKFLTLFTFLFGFSFVLQKKSIAHKGGKLGALYTRRLLVLAIIGVLHATYLYYADVLFMYAITGFVLLLCHRFADAALFKLGLALTALSILLIFGLEGVALQSKQYLLICLLLLLGFAFFAGKYSLAKFSAVIGLVLFGAVAFLQFQAAPPSAQANDYSIQQARAYSAYAVDKTHPAFANKNLSWPVSQDQLAEVDLSSDDQNTLEALVFRNGPQSLLTQMRLDKFFELSVIGFVLYFFWRIAGLFFLSAALASYGMENISDRNWARIRTCGLFAGLFLTLFSSAASAFNMLHDGAIIPFASLLHDLAAYAICAFLVAQFYLWRDGIAEFRVGRWLASGGRMALSNYIAQSAVMAFIAGPSGLSLFGNVTHWQAFGLAVAVFAVLVSASHSWLNHYSMGPLEGVWRSITYLRWRPAKQPK